MRILIVAIVFLALAAPAAAQHEPFTKKLFDVTRCDPKANVMTNYPGYAGFVPGYYPGAGRYYWGDPYGYRFYQPPVTTASPTLGIDFTNRTNTTMKEIVWGLFANGNIVAEAKDVGTFSPGAEIKHEYGLSPNVFPLQTGLPQCIALAVTFEDGRHIRNPNLPHVRRQMYESPHP
jgi:hypothetical protein